MNSQGGFLLRPGGVFRRFRHIRTTLINVLQCALRSEGATEHGDQVFADVHPLRIDIVDGRLVDSAAHVLVGIDERL